MYNQARNLVTMRRTKEPVNYYNLGGKIQSKVYNSILELVGNTPLIKLNKIPQDYGLSCEIYAKCEFLNPSGSIKDRVALTMMQDARKMGVVNERTVFVEATSGNTGIGIALNATLAGNKCIIVTEEKNSAEKMDTINLLGGEVIRTKNKDQEYALTHKLKDDSPNSVVILSQSDNDVNANTHYEITAEEILSALGQIDAVVMGAGTGGTMTGIGMKMKKVNPNCTVVAAEPEGSVMFNVEAKYYPTMIEGIGGDSIPMNLDKSVCDHYEVVTDKEAFLMSRELVKKEGLLCGGSGGAAMVAAIKAARTLNIGSGKRVVVILPDGIRNYMTKFVSDQWMEANHFMEPPEHTMTWWKNSITDVNLKRTYPKLNEDISCSSALEAMNINNVNVAVIVDNVGQYVGAVSKNGLRTSATNPTKLPGQTTEDLNFRDSVTYHLDKHVYTLAINGKKGKPTVGLLSRMLDITPYVIIGKEGFTDDKKFFIPSGVVTADDVLDYIQHAKI